MNEIDKWYADKCGVLTHSAQAPLGCGTTSTSHSFFIKNGQKQHYYKWAIGDARCREIIREVFGLSTKHNPDGWLCVQYKWTKMGDGHVCLNGRGKTIREAELTLLQAIFEQENKNG